MADKVIRKPYWVVDIIKIVNFSSCVYIRSWDEPTRENILEAIKENISDYDWCEGDDTEYDWVGKKICTHKEAVQYKIYDVNPNEPTTKNQVDYNPDQFLMDFMKKPTNEI